VRHDGRVTLAVAKEALAALDVDDQGLDDVDRKLLATIVDKFSGGPVGLETLGAALSEDAETIEDVYEPFLLQGGYLKRTPRGRVATERAYQHLGKTPPTSAASLWEDAQEA
jgi:Holliday junction DNA helicase RuvB